MARIETLGPTSSNEYEETHIDIMSKTSIHSVVEMTHEVGMLTSQKFILFLLNRKFTF